MPFQELADALLPIAEAMVVARCCSGINAELGPPMPEVG